MHDRDYAPASIIKRFETMLENYDDGNTNLGQPPKPLFDESGDFSPDNRNSGQDIRAVLREKHMLDERLGDPFMAWFDQDGTSLGVVWSGTIYRDGQNHIVLNVITDDLIINCDTYFISWYESRDGVDIFTKNNRPIALDEYSVLLDILDRAGFFRNEKRPNNTNDGKKLRDIGIGEVFRIDYGVRPGYYMPVGDSAIREDQALALVVDMAGVISTMNCDAGVLKAPSDPDWEYPGPDPEEIAASEHTTLDKLVPGSVFILNGTSVCRMLAISEQLPCAPGKRLAVNLRNGQLSELDENAAVAVWHGPRIRGDDAAGQAKKEGTVET